MSSTDMQRYTKIEKPQVIMPFLTLNNALVSDGEDNRQTDKLFF